MNRELYALAAGLGTNVGGYVVSVAILSLGGTGAPSLLWPLSVILWLVSMFVGGWVASVVAGGRQFLLGYLSAALGLLGVCLTFQFVLHIALPPLATAAGVVIFSALGALGTLTYSRKSK